MYVCADLLKITSLTRGLVDTPQFTVCDIGILNKHGDTYLYRQRIGCLFCVRHWDTSVSLCHGIYRSHEKRIAVLCSECEKLFWRKSPKAEFKLVGPSKGPRAKKVKFWMRMERPKRWLACELGKMEKVVRLGGLLWLGDNKELTYYLLENQALNIHSISSQIFFVCNSILLRTETQAQIAEEKSSHLNQIGNRWDYFPVLISQPPFSVITEHFQSPHWTPSCLESGVPALICGRIGSTAERAARSLLQF